MAKPIAESCEQNKLPILEVLRQEWDMDTGTILEIGSGTGQHAVFFAAYFPQLRWQTSDLPQYHPGIRAWIEEDGPDNVLAPLILDVAASQWPQTRYEAVFSANTAHIMSWPQVIAMFQGVGKALKIGGKFCLYGPFNYNRRYTSESNARFDQWLKQRDPDSGIRNAEDLIALALSNDMVLINDHEMPVNNRTLVWRKSDQQSSP